MHIHGMMPQKVPGNISLIAFTIYPNDKSIVERSFYDVVMLNTRLSASQKQYIHFLECISKKLTINDIVAQSSSLSFFYHRK